MTQPRAEIFSQGDEVVTGEIVDTNAAWLAEALTGMGFDIARHTAVGDRLEALIDLLREIAERADLCVCTGGLGPTCDDLTAEAVSRAFDRPLVMDSVALGQIEDWFRRMGRNMPAVNRKQALLPAGAMRLDNAWGTAPGFSVTAGRCRFYFMPGVPREMKAMFRAAIAPQLPPGFELGPRPRVVLRTVGLGESALQERLDGVDLDGAQLGFRAGGAENQVKLAFPSATPEAAIEAVIRRVTDALGEVVYAVVRDGVGPAQLTAVVGDLLRVRHARLYLLETASAGSLASRCGGEDWLAGARVEPVPEHLLAELGQAPAESPSADARAVAKSLRERSGADYALLQWGGFTLAELRDASARVELLVAVAGPDGVTVEERDLAGDLSRKRDTAAVFSLDVLRRLLSSA
jgi:competence/damage-inducible protein CinA-like protein